MKWLKRLKNPSNDEVVQRITKLEAQFRLEMTDIWEILTNKLDKIERRVTQRGKRNALKAKHLNSEEEKSKPGGILTRRELEVRKRDS